MKVALCCIIKNENLYLKEYIEYYKKLEFAKIFIYDNNDIDGEDPNNILKEYIDNNFVEVINYRGLKYCQAEAYQECYRKYNNEYDWIAFFDADEFLTLVNHTSINDYLSQRCFNNYNVILLHWKVYGDNEQLRYENKSVLERFNQPCKNSDIHFLNTFVKSIIKGGIQNLIWTHKLPHSSVHLPNVLFGINGNLAQMCCDSEGNPKRPQQSDIAINYNNAYIKHISCKSTEEFIYKRKRGYADFPINTNWNNIINDYFSYNTFSMDKLKLMYEIINNNKIKIEI